MKKYILSLIVLFGFEIESFSQTLFEDPQGNFVLDLYDGLEPQPQQNPDSYIFKQENYSLIMMHDKETKSLDELFNGTVELLKGSGLKKLENKEPVKQMMINGIPAKRGEFISKFKQGDISVQLTGIALSYKLENSGISAFLILSDNNIKRSLDEINHTLYSLRTPGSEITGVSDIKEVEFDPETVVAVNEPVSSEPIIFKHDGMTITFPPGWSVTPKGRNDSEDIIGKFDNKSIYSGCFIIGLTGIIWNKKLAIQTADGIGSNTLPGAKLRKKEEVKLENNNKGVLTIHDGVSIAEGKEVEMSVLTFTQKVGKYHLIYVGTGPTSSSNKLEADILTAANSVE